MLKQKPHNNGAKKVKKMARESINLFYLRNAQRFD